TTPGGRRIPPIRRLRSLRRCRTRRAATAGCSPPPRADTRSRRSAEAFALLISLPSPHLQPERRQDTGARLRHLHPVARAIEFGALPLQLAIEIIRRDDHALVQARSRRTLDRVAKRYDAIVVRQRVLKAIDRGEIQLNRAPQAIGERRFLRGDDRPL